MVKVTLCVRKEKVNANNIEFIKWKYEKVSNLDVSLFFFLDFLFVNSRLFPSSSY